MFQAILESTVCWNHVNPAAGLGIGPRLDGSEPPVLPLHHPAIKRFS